MTLLPGGGEELAVFAMRRLPLTPRESWRSVM
jgi:hypothetical protein